VTVERQGASGHPEHDHVVPIELVDAVGADHVARTLDWIIRHDPVIAAATITEIIGKAERRGIPRHVSARSIRTALGLDSKLDAAARRDFLDRVL
jgi:hypothetical protein